MKVLIDLSALLPLRTGVETYMLELVRGLARVDGETRYTVFVDREDRGLLELPPNFSVVAAPLRPRAARLTFQQGILPVAALTSGADVVHSPSFIMPLWRGRARHLLTIHDLTSFTRPECHTRLRRSRSYRAAVRTSIHRAHSVVVPSKHVRSELFRLFPRVGATHVRAIPHGIDPRFTPDAGPPPARLGLPRRYVLSVGTLEPRKNLVALLRAYEALVVEGIAEDLVLAGKAGWGQGELQRSLARPALRGRVHILGYVDEDVLPSLYARARAFVYPSLEEGFGFPPLEAMASGVPTVASASSSLEEYLAGAAQLTSPLDPRGLAGALRAVLSDDGLRKRLRRAGLARAASFSWDRAALETLDLYETLATARPPRRRAAALRVPVR